MEQFTTTAYSAGEQRKYVSPLRGSPHPVTRRALMSAVTRASKSLQLAPGDILVLDTLLSFLPCRDKATGVDRPVSANMILIVYAQNETICARAHGMNERVLRRHLAKLRSAGLIDRKDSATGKRFPLRSGGVVRDAFGIDLSPLLGIYPEIAVEADRLDSEAAEIRALRAEALALRANLLRASERLCSQTLEFVETVKTVLRRSTLTLAQVAGLIRDLLRIDRGQSEEAEAQLSTQAPCPSEIAAQQDRKPNAQNLADISSETAKESGRDGLNVRQVESVKIDLNKEGDPEYAQLLTVWAACPNISSLCPDGIRSPSRLREAVFLFGSYLTLKSEVLADGVHRIGWLNMLRALEYLAENANRIKSPTGYFKIMLERFEAGQPIAGQR